VTEAFNDSLHVDNVLSRSEFIELEESAMDHTGTVVPMEDVKTLAVEFVEEVLIDLDTEYTPGCLVEKA